jgi:hypothetical protein
MTRISYEVTAESIVVSDGVTTVFEFPRVREPYRQILEPLTDHQLAACLRQGRLVRREDVCESGLINHYPSWHIVNAADTLADRPDRTKDELLIHEGLMWLVSKDVSEYWSHVTEENQQHHPGSEEDYLRGLVQRIHRRVRRDGSDLGGRGR